MATKLYVGNLSYSMTDDQLKQTFAAAGEVVSANVITDKMSGRSRGFGFVEMNTPEDAAKAIEMFDGQELEGRKLVVNEARPKTDRPPRTGGFGGGGRGYGGGGYGGGGGNRY